MGDFRLERLLGRGGQGTVWEAHQLSIDRRVALKLVTPERVSEQTLALFHREARAGGRLSHPGIVTVYAWGQSDGTHWIAQELVPGRTLRDAIDEARQAPELSRAHDRWAAEMVARIAEAMQKAHDTGVIHRDLKPTNVLLTTSGEPKVTDFGLARIREEEALSISGDVRGTYDYMSPEQVSGRGSRTDDRTDVFSLGVVLYELLTLHRPFEGDNALEIARQILTRDPVDPRALRFRIPADLAVIVGKALEKSPSHRYGCMADFAADLRRYVASEPIQARPAGPLDRFWKWARRHPTVSLPAGVLLVAILVLTGVWSRGAEVRAAWNRKRAREAYLDATLVEYRDAGAAGLHVVGITAREEAVQSLRLAIVEDPALDAARLHAAVLLAELERGSEADALLAGLADQTRCGAVPGWIRAYRPDAARTAVAPPQDWSVSARATPAERFYAGRAYQRRGLATEALEALKPLQIDPDYAVPAMYLLGIVCSTRQHFDQAEAIRWLTAAWTLAPRNAAVGSNLAAVLLRASSINTNDATPATYLEDALLVAERLTPENQDYAPLWRNYIAILGSLPEKDFARLRDVARHAADLSPDTAQVQLMLGAACLESAQTEVPPNLELLAQAEAAFEEALRLQPDLPKAPALLEFCRELLKAGSGMTR